MLVDNERIDEKVLWKKNKFRLMIFFEYFYVIIFNVDL